MTRRSLWTLAGLVAVAALPAVLTPYAFDLVLRVAIYALFALSLELLVGTAGLVSLGHAAFLGVGAYTAVWAGAQGVDSVPLMVVLSVLAAALYALLVGALSLRTQGAYFIMVTLAFAQMAYFVVHDTHFVGGSDGMFLAQRPVWLVGGVRVVNLDDKLHLYAFTMAALLGSWALLARLKRSQFGHALVGIRVNELRMRSAGHPAYAIKLVAFVLAGGLAGLAGFLWAMKDAAVNPELLSWHESGAVLLMLILGGLGQLRGAVLGAVVFTLLKEGLQSEALLGPLALRWQLTLGVSIIALVMWRPKGLMGRAA